MPPSPTPISERPAPARIHPWAAAAGWAALAAGLLLALAWGLRAGPAWLAPGLAAPGALALAWLAWLQRRQRRWQQAVAELQRRVQCCGEDPAQDGGDAAATPVPPELQPLAQALGGLHQRLRRMAELQAGQVEALRRQVHQDAVTGLSNRRHLLASLAAVLESDEAPAQATLLLVRLHDLAGLNQRIGREAADRLLRALALSLQSYPQHVADCLLGRLDGGDFALLLPAGGVAEDTAQALRQALGQSLATVDPLARVSVAALELRPPCPADVALVQAASALEAGPPLSEAEPVLAEDPDDPAPDPDRNPWHRRVMRALAQGRVRLGEFPVITADERVLLLDCPLRVQLAPGGEFEPAARWLPQVARNRLGAVVDERALMLALAAIAADGQARCINLGRAALMSAGFVESATLRLAAAPEAAGRLWVDLPESLALDCPERVRALSRRWRPLGVMLGLEHAGEGLARLQGLMDLGLDCVRIDARFVNGIAAPEAGDARRHLQGLVRLVQGMGLGLTAEGVRAPADLEVLWSLGFDAATGPAVQARLPA